MSYTAIAAGQDCFRRFRALSLVRAESGRSFRRSAEMEADNCAERNFIEAKRKTAKYGRAPVKRFFIAYVISAAAKRKRAAAAVARP